MKLVSPVPAADPGVRFLPRLMKVCGWKTTKLIVAGLMLAAIVSAADYRLVGQSLLQLHGGWLAAAMAMFLAQSLVSAWRWQWLAREIAPLSLAEAARHTLLASACNLIIPAKLGDLSKSGMLPASTDAAVKRNMFVVLREKLADVAALLGWMAFGACGFSGTATLIALAACAVVSARASLVRNSSRSWWTLGAFSLVLWMLHLAQIDLFMKSAGVFVEPSVALARVPAAIFAGLLPLSFCGIGTRDTALIWLFSDVAPAPAMAVVGMLTALRYLVPGLAGVGLMIAPRRSSAPSAVPSLGLDVDRSALASSG